MTFYADFTLPFIIGVLALFAIIALKYISWLKELPKQDLLLIAKGLFTYRTITATWEVVRESLLHKRIF